MTPPTIVDQMAGAFFSLVVIAGPALMTSRQIGSATGRSAHVATAPRAEIEVIVVPIRDVGISMPKGADGRPINVRFTTAIRSHLSDLASDIYTVRERSSGAKGVIRLHLEGDMAHTDSDTGDAGAYLCTLRLYEDKKPRRLLGQWSGTAATLRDLTSNLRHDRTISPLGLLGELGSRVNESIRARAEADAPSLIGSVLDRCSQSLKVDLSLASNPGDGSKKFVSPGERYRVEVRSPREGEMWLIAIPSEGSATMFLGNAETGFAVAAEDRYSLPTRGLFTAPQKEGSLTLIALVRQSETDGRPTPERRKNTEKNTAPFLDDARDTVSNHQPGMPVMVVSASAPAVSLGDVRWLLERVLSEPQGRWIGQALEVPVRPVR